MVSSIPKRASPADSPVCCNRLLSTRDATPSNTSRSRSAPALDTASAASSVNPPTKTASRRNSFCSSPVSSSWLQSMARRSVCWRSGRSRAPPVNNRSRLSKRPRIAAGVRTFTRAAASSMASGRPSRRAQISTTAAALSSPKTKPGFTARARWINSATAGYSESSSTGPRFLGSGSASGGTCNSCSP